MWLNRCKILTAKGVIACAASQMWMVPIDVVSQHQQINSAERFSVAAQLDQTRQLVRRIAVNEGIVGFYRGFWISLCTFGPQSAIFWSLFGKTKSSLDHSQNENLQVCLSAATSSGNRMAIYWNLQKLQLLNIF